MQLLRSRSNTSLSSRMRQGKQAIGSRNRPLVGIIADGVSSYGRAILRGVTRYANLQRRWLICKELRQVLDLQRIDWSKLDGAILAGVLPETYDYARARCRHVIYCSGSADPAVGPVVRLDDDAAGVMVAEHLLDCRLRHFAFYGTTRKTETLNRRLAGFSRKIEASGFVVNESPVHRPNHEEWVTHVHRPRLRRWLEDLPKPIGIMAFDDAVAHDLAEACVEADIAVPEQVAIIGVNNDDLMCESAWPPLSSVNPDYSRIGYTAAGILERLIEGEKLSPEERLVELAPIGVIQRQSTSLLAVDDSNLAMAMRFIREHACDPCSVDDVLRIVPVGRRWLERKFQLQFGRSPHEEITRVRIDTARRLLVDPNITIDSVASRCGFSNVKNFYLTFGKSTGTTPAAFRRAMLTGA